MLVFLQLFFGWLYSHVFEYIAHRYVLHNHKRFYTAFKNHFAIHHKTARKQGMYDEGYESLISSKFETASLVIIGIVHLPLFYFVPWFAAMTYVNLITYYVVHKKSHIDVEWGKKWLPWHYAHHMGKDQNKNWGVRTPIIDKIVGTSDY